MACFKRDSSGRLVSVRFVLSGFGICLFILLLCCAFAGPALAVRPDVPGGVGALPVKDPVVPSGGSVPSQSVPQVLDRAVVSPERSSLVQPGIVSGPVKTDLSVSVSAGYDKYASLIKEGVEVEPNLFKVTDPNDKTLKLISIQKDGSIIEGRMIGPGLPPVHYDEKSNLANLNVVSTKVVEGADVPAMTWSYGCSPTSATMLFGYLDRNGYSNIYNGPTNGGVFPLTNAEWGSSTEGSGQCPLTASQQGLDGRLNKGHKDDYYSSYGSSIDPYNGAWIEHTPHDSIADFMGTSMYNKYASTDGSTWFWTYNDGSPLYNPTDDAINSRDGIHGMRLFAESRGYTVETNYNQKIYGYNGNNNGFTYAQYKAEIDAGYPVLIQVTGHTMLGVGYSGTDQIILHNTWDYNQHTMTWGGTYEGMQHYGVGVIHLTEVTMGDKIGVVRRGSTQSQWILANEQGGVYKRFNYGTRTDIPITGDWDGDGKTTIGVVRRGSTQSQWILANEQGGVYKRFNYGTTTDLPITGDWDGDGNSTIGVVRRGSTQSQWILANEQGGVYKRFNYGTPTDIPITGDWNDDGKTTIGVVRRGSTQSQWILANEQGGVYKRFNYGTPTDIPITGDWDGTSGIASIEMAIAEPAETPVQVFEAPTTVTHPTSSISTVERPVKNSQAISPQTGGLNPATNPLAAGSGAMFVDRRVI